jgi:hypothetical protein
VGKSACGSPIESLANSSFRVCRVEGGAAYKISGLSLGFISGSSVIELAPTPWDIPEIEMTVVAIWLEPTEQVLWSVADTRISAPGPTGGRKIMTDSGAKLFALPIHCQAARMNLDFRKKTLYLSSVGYAFAGDVFPATMTFATASTFLQNLTTVGSDDPPRLSEIAAMIGRLGQRFSTEALGSSNGKYGKFTAAVFGWCPTLNRFAIYELKPRLTTSTFEMQIEETLPKDNLSVVSFGTGAARLIQQMDNIRQRGDEYNRTARIPKIAAEVLIEQDMGDVGGSLSIGAATQNDFHLYSYVTPIVKGKPEASSLSDLTHYRDIG